MSTPAWIDLDGLANMRDLGGLPTRDGGQVQPGRLLRSDNLQDLTPGDVDRLMERGVSDVVDLRRDLEVERTGPGPLRSVETLRHHHLSLFVEDSASIEGAVTWRQQGREARDENHWASHYLGYLAERPDSVSGALDVVARAEGAVIVHCAAGKDRTGTITALALAVAGVDDDVITADYLATRERIERVVERMSASEVYAANLRGRALEDHLPDPDAMPRLLAAVRDTSGSVEGWLREVGWTDADVDRLRLRLTRP